jgi:ribonucleoside-diphosphate reductase beta chain
MNILKARVVYKPFEYPQFYDYCVKQQNAFWLVDKIPMGSDVQDWKQSLTDREKNLIASILKGFTQVELFIGNDYWANRIARKIKKPEVQMMAVTFSSFEVVHAQAYSHLEETLGLENYEAFLHEPTAKAKIDRLIGAPFKTVEDIALSIAVFSAFNEGVNLFSSFAVLLSFSRRNLLKGVGQIIGYSIADEQKHSEAGCELFRIIVKENPEIFTDEFKKKIYDAARTTIELEDNFLEYAFGNGDIEGLTLYDMKQFIRNRANLKLQELGLKMNWKNIDQDSLKRMEWFDVLANSNLSHQDFFAGRVTSYSKITKEQGWDNLFDSEENP